MYYILVKGFDSAGSIVFESEDLKEIDILDTYLTYKCGTNKEVIVLNKYKEWGAYAPFKVYDNVGDFLNKVLESNV